MQYEQHFYGRSTREPARDRPVPHRRGGSGGTLALIGAIAAAVAIVGLMTGEQRPNAATAETVSAHAIAAGSAAD